MRQSIEFLIEDIRTFSIGMKKKRIITGSANRHIIAVIAARNDGRLPQKETNG
jgi:hypothetical protein